jgi:hypothetical protein
MPCNMDRNRNWQIRFLCGSASSLLASENTMRSPYFPHQTVSAACIFVAVLSACSASDTLQPFSTEDAASFQTARRSVVLIGVTAVQFMTLPTGEAAPRRHGCTLTGS